MTVTLISNSLGSYQAVSTDIVANKLPGASIIGASVYILDTGDWYRIQEDLTLAPLAFTALSKTPVVDVSFNGQIYISGSNTPISGSTLNITNKSGFVLKSHPNNTGVLWIWNSSGSQTSGFPLSTNEAIVYSGSALSGLNYGVSGATRACLCWIKV